MTGSGQRTGFRVSIVTLAAVALVAAAAGFAARGWLGSGRAAAGGGSGAEPGGGPPDRPAARAPQLYTCSMHPQIRTPDPNAKCPICAMDLIPVPADEEGDEHGGEVPRLRLSPGAAALMDIRTWPVERRAVEVEIALYGAVAADESRIFDVVARAESYVERLLVNTPWQPVAAGDPIAELYSPAVAAALSELLVVRDASADVLRAARGRAQRLGVTDGQLDEVLRSGHAPRTIRAVAPGPGFVLAVAAREGEWLREGERLTRLVDLSRVWVNLEAYERDLPWLAAGMPVRFAAAALPGREFEGAVAFVDPALAERSRTVRVRVEAGNPDGRLKPGLFVTARVKAPYRPAAAAEGGRGAASGACRAGFGAVDHGPAGRGVRA